MDVENILTLYHESGQEGLAMNFEILVHPPHTNAPPKVTSNKKHYNGMLKVCLSRHTTKVPRSRIAPTPRHFQGMSSHYPMQSKGKYQGMDSRRTVVGMKFANRAHPGNRVRPTHNWPRPKSTTFGSKGQKCWVSWKRGGVKTYKA